MFKHGAFLTEIPLKKIKRSHGKRKEDGINYSIRCLTKVENILENIDLWVFFLGNNTIPKVLNFWNGVLKLKTTPLSILSFPQLSNILSFSLISAVDICLKFSFTSMSFVTVRSSIATKGCPSSIQMATTIMS